MKRGFIYITSTVSFTAGGFIGVQYGRRKTENNDSQFDMINDNVTDISGHKKVNVKLKEKSVFGLCMPSVFAATKIAKEKQLIPMSSSPTRAGEIMHHGYPSLDNIRTFDDYVLSYDKKTKIPHWVFEHLTRERVKWKEDVGRDKCRFAEDLVIHPYFRATNEDYNKSGYDRGHLAAAANHRHSQVAMAQTFTLSNIAPQVGKGFNRHGWNTLEKCVRRLTKSYPHVYVCTGPLFLARQEGNGRCYVKYEVIGQNQVAVPTHFFKVIVCAQDDGEYDLLSYVMPNEKLPEDMTMDKYMVPISTIERAAGLLLFEKIPKTRFSHINGKKVQLALR